jgi:hypothetical protein
VERTTPERRRNGIDYLRCEYGRFQNFAEFLFPRDAACYEDKHQVISAKIVDISTEPAADPALFAPPAGAAKIDQCFGKVTMPKVTAHFSPSMASHLDQVLWLRVWFVVDSKDKPEEMKVIRAPDKKTHDAALKELRTFDFARGTCDGHPISMPMSIDVPVNAR